MKRLVLLLTLLAATAAVAGPQDRAIITTRGGASYFDCKIKRIFPDGISFTHRNGAARIAFKDLPENLRKEFRYDPQKEAEYQREQAALRQEEQKREQQREAAMQERLMEAQMAEASYLAAASAAAAAAPVVPPMSMALPGEPVTQVTYQTPAWVGTPVTGPSLGGRAYGRSGFGGYYPYTGGYYSYPAYGYGYPSYGYGYPHYGHGYPGAYVSPTIYRSWNVGNGFRVGVGVTPFGGGIRLFP